MAKALSMTMRLKHMATIASPKRRYSVHAVTNKACLPPPPPPPPPQPAAESAAFAASAAAAADDSGAAAGVGAGAGGPSKMPMVARAAKLK